MIIDDLRAAFRTIRRNKIFALTALAVFAFGIGATATVFSIIDSVLLRPASFPDPASVLLIEAAEQNGEMDRLAPSLFDSIRSRKDLFSTVVGFRSALFTVTDVPVPDQAFGLSVSGNFFTMLQARPWLGRILLPEDDRPGAPRTVLLSYQIWRRMFAGDPGVVGKVATIDGVLYTIIGVMPANFVLPVSGGSMWTALRLTAADLASPYARRIGVAARLQPSVTLSAVQQALNVLASSLTSNPQYSNKPLRIRASHWRQQASANHRLLLWVAMGMVSGLLLIACANLTSILLARGVGRRRDYAIRLAAGASRSRLVRQAFFEVFLLAFTALPVACAGTALALRLIREHLLTAQNEIPNLSRIHLNTEGLLFSFGAAFAAALLCGLLPALSTTRIDIFSGLRETGVQTGGNKPVRRLLHILVAIEAAVCMLLLTTSGLLVRGLVRLTSDDHGLQPDRVLSLRLPTGSWQELSGKQTPEDKQRRIRRYLEFIHRAQTVPGVEAAALASSLPLSHTVVRTRLAAPPQSASTQAHEIMPISQAVTADYFRVMGIPLLAGRSFEPADTASKLKVAIVNQAFARQYLAGGDPTGKFLIDPEHQEKIQVVGMVKDSPHLDLAEKVEPEVYQNFEQTTMTPFLTGLVVRTAANPQSLAHTLRTALSLGDREQAVVHVETLQALIDENIWQRRFSAWLFSLFASIALGLSGIGIYGVVSYVARSRRRDFGVHLALGAAPFDLFRLAALQTLAPVVAGIALGVAGSYWTSKWIASLLYKTRPFDPITLLISLAILSLAAFAAAAGPASRAVRIDPAETLRCD